MLAVVIVLGVIVLLAVLLVVWGVVSYNGLIKLRNRVQEAWRQIDVELTRRHDLIPNLVEAVKGYASHERETLDAVIHARNAATQPGTTPAQQAQQEGELSATLGRLFALTEAYPDLKANQNFLALQAELSSTEDRIASGRRYYNAVVRELNTKVESVPSNIVAGVAKVGREEYFEESDPQVRAAPSVSFSPSGQASLPEYGSAPGGAGATGPRRQVEPGQEPGAPGAGA